MKYADFKKSNDESKSLFACLGKVSNVSLSRGTCTLTFQDNVTHNLPILSVVNDIYFNNMGAISNPSALKSWFKD